MRKGNKLIIVTASLTGKPAQFVCSGRSFAPKQPEQAWLFAKKSEQAIHSLLRRGALARIRTGGVPLRRRTLYPAEVQAHKNSPPGRAVRTLPSPRPLSRPVADGKTVFILPCTAGGCQPRAAKSGKKGPAFKSKGLFGDTKKPLILRFRRGRRGRRSLRSCRNWRNTPRQNPAPWR